MLLTQEQKYQRRLRLIKESKIKSINKKIQNSDYHKKKELLSLFDRSYNIRKNTIKFNSHNTEAHELAKCILALDLLKSGKTFYCEAIFLSGLRADLVCLEDFSAYEVIVSESEHSIRNKQENYPLPILYFKAEDIISKYLTKVIQ